MASVPSLEVTINFNAAHVACTGEGSVSRTYVGRGITLTPSINDLLTISGASQYDVASIEVVWS